MGHRSGMVADDRLGRGLTQGCFEESSMLAMRIGLFAVRVRATPNPGELTGASHPLHFRVRVAPGGEIATEPDI
jgi:hypothetical protein